jgi:hypothetical protein
MNIKIKDFSKQYKKEYNFLYDNKDNIAGYAEAVEAFDDFIKTAAGSAFVGEFARFRGDLLTSDGEAAAFMFALDSMTA